MDFIKYVSRDRNDILNICNKIKIYKKKVGVKSDPWKC